jgi:hypothetical protein
VLLGIALLILLVQTWTSLSGGLSRIPESRTLAQRAQTVAEIVCGLLSLSGILTTFRRRSWLGLIQWCWVCSVTLAAGPASVIWGRTSPLRGLLISGATLLAALGVLWMWRAGARRPGGA